MSVPVQYASAVILVAATFAGCGGDEAIGPHMADLPAKRFRGDTLTVTLDGRQTRPVAGVASPAWSVDPIGPRPTLRVDVEPAILGLPVRKVRVLIHPIVAGRVDERTTYRPLVDVSVVGADVQLANFECIAPDGYRQVEGLPPGEYQFIVHVIGTRSWDRQIIEVTVQ